MPFVIEDGTGKSDANSYISSDDAKAYALARGVTLPSDIDAKLTLAMDYLESRDYVWARATTTQALSWPRKHQGWLCNDPAQWWMPAEIAKAQAQLVIEQFNGVVLQPTTPGGVDGRFVIREKVDVIETTYSERLGTLDTPTMRAVDALLRHVVVLGGGAAYIPAVRV